HPPDDEKSLAASPDLKATLAHPQHGGDASSYPNPRRDGEVRETFGVAPQHRPDQFGYLGPQHAMLHPAHRVSDVVERVRQRQAHEPVAGAAMIATLPPPPNQRFNAHRVQHRDEV